MKLAEILYREILFHTENGKSWLENPGFFMSEVHKMSGVPKVEAIALFKKWIDVGFIEKVPGEEYALRINTMFDFDQLPD